MSFREDANNSQLEPHIFGLCLVCLPFGPLLSACFSKPHTCQLKNLGFKNPKSLNPHVGTPISVPVSGVLSNIPWL